MWVKLTDRIDEDPRILVAGPLGLALYVASLAYANRMETDGFIPETKARLLIDWGGHGSTATAWPTNTLLVVNKLGEPVVVGADVVIAFLLTAGLWEEVPTGYQIVGYAEDQFTKAELDERRKAWASRQQRYRATKRSVQSRRDVQGDSPRD